MSALRGLRTIGRIATGLHVGFRVASLGARLHEGRKKLSSAERYLRQKRATARQSQDLHNQGNQVNQFFPGKGMTARYMRRFR